jgi:FkbM family methyltransferase
MKKVFYLFVVIVAVLAFWLMFSGKKPKMADHADGSVCPSSKQAGNSELHGKYFEDFVLSLVFAEKEKGAYIDVGASGPYEDSISRYFYENGWRGINIEPVQKWHQEFLKSRPEDVSLNVGVSNQSGSKNFYRIFAEISDELNGFSTFDEGEIYGKKHESSELKVMTLDQILADHPMAEIDFMAVNVSRKEMEILSGINLSKHRPSVIIIEAPKPEEFNLSGHEWDSFLSRNKYHLIMFDGLNSYYVAAEQYENLYKHFMRAYNCAAASNKKDRVVNNKMIFITNVM